MKEVDERRQGNRPGFRFVPLLAIVAIGVFGIATEAAGATCYSSSPNSASHPDSATDGEGLAPQILRLDVALDSSCGITVTPVIDAPLPEGLADGETVGIFIDIDENAATGDPRSNGADRFIIVGGRAGPDYAPTLVSWNGVEFDTASRLPLPAMGLAGFRSDLNRLGVPSPVSIGIRAVSVLRINTPVGEIIARDAAPDFSQPPFKFPVTFSTARSCVVPQVRGMTVKRAKKKLKQAGCRYRVRGKGRVVSTSPRARTRTTKIVIVRARPKRKARAWVRT
jgi:PASTA domain